MKLYTEEQVRMAMKLYNETSYSYTEAIEKLTPIELPSDEEIMYMSLPKKGGSHSSDYMEGFNKGAKWLKVQYKQQEK